MIITMPGKVYNACFDPLATDVPRESGWPEAKPSRVGYGYQYTYNVTPEQLADMLDHAYTWGSGLAFGTDPYTAAEARAVLRWVAKSRGETT